MKTSRRKQDHDRQVKRRQRTLELRENVYRSITLPNGVTVEYSSRVKATVYGQPERVQSVVELVGDVRPVVPFNYPYPTIRKLGEIEELHVQEITLTPEESLFIQKMIRDQAMKSIEDVDFMSLTPDEMKQHIEMSQLQYHSANLMVKLMAPFKPLDKGGYVRTVPIEETTAKRRAARKKKTRDASRQAGFFVLE